MEDGLYISDVWVCGVDCSLTYQGNDLTKPDTRTVSYSNSFTLPDSLAVRDLTEGGEQLDAGGVHPYRQLPAFVIDGGEKTFEGLIEFDTFNAGWKVNLYDSILSFFDAIADKALTALDLSRLDHPWTIDHINQANKSATSTNPYPSILYPFLDYGGMSGSEIPYDTLFPSISLLTIIGAICQAAGYKPVGDWLTDPLLQRSYLPFVNGTAVAHDQDWIDDRSAWITANGTTNAIHLEDGHPIDLILPLNVDNDPVNGYKQGRLKPYSTDRYCYVCPDNMRLAVVAQVMFVGITHLGLADIRLELWQNGQKIAEDYYSEGGDHLDVPLTLKIDENVDCYKGDNLYLKLTGSSRTTFSDYSFYFSLAADETYVTFIPDGAIHFGDTWTVSPNLPADLSQSDLMLGLAKLMQGTYEVDDKRKTVELIPLDNVIKNIPSAVDWSRNVDETVEPEFNVQLDPYKKKNWLRWKQQSNKTDIGFGDGYLPCDVAVSGEVDLFELPFMACLNSGQSIAGYGSPVLIKTRTVTGKGDSLNISDSATTARIILVEPSKTIAVKTEVLDTSGTVVPAFVTLTACWWSIRPNNLLADAATKFNLSFASIGAGGEQPLIDRYFSVLKRVLRRPRKLVVSVELQPSDIATLDLHTPVILQNVRIGSLDVNRTLFYLNAIGPYYSGKVCSATLIAI